MVAGTSTISTHGLKTLETNVQSSIDKLNQYPSDPDATSIRNSYNTLLTSINTSIRDVSGASINTIASVQSTYNSDVVKLDITRDVILIRIKGYTNNDVLRQVSYGVGMIFAAILLTNHMVGEKWYFQLFYIIWGAIFYPVVLLYCLYDPPFWRVLLFPIFDVSSKEWYIRYSTPFNYEDPSKAAINLLGKNNGKIILRLFTASVAAFLITMQILP